MNMKKWVGMTALLLCFTFLLFSCGKPDNSADLFDLNTESFSLTVGENRRLSLRRNGTVLTEDVFWNSDNPDVVSVDGKGTVTAVSAGTTFVRAVFDGKDYACSVTVQSKPGLDRGELSMMMGTERTLELLANGEAISEGVKWISADETVVQVKNGLLTAVGIGDTEVKAIYKNRTYLCYVDVFDVFLPEGTYYSSYYVEEIGVKFEFDLQIEADGSFVYSRREAQSESMDLAAEVIRRGQAKIEDAFLILNCVDERLEFEILGKNSIRSMGAIVVSTEMKDMKVELRFDRVIG